VRIYELTHSTLHAKIITVDGVYGSVGSFNLDYLSTYRNLEVALCMLDRVSLFSAVIFFFQKERATIYNFCFCFCFVFALLLCRFHTATGSCIGR
jgi:phosphatidylserine/phosphatidylglycerophosphate/cardiolipin synthase-like enzyme